MINDFFYSKSANLYISRKPLRIESRVKEAAQKIGIHLEWDDEGRINNIDFDDAKKLLEALNSKIFSPSEYWKVFSDALNEKDENMLDELTSDKYTEWLDRIYLRDETEIDHPEIVSKYNYKGEKRKAVFPYGRPGWFNPEENIDKNGIPIKVELGREKHATSWKYWSPDLSVTKLSCAPIRGYVTSVGKPSWDLGIPVDARQPLLMIRECRVNPLMPPIDSKILEKAEKIIKSQDEEALIDFVIKYGSLFSGSGETTIYKIREKLFNKLGMIFLKGKNIEKAAKIISNNNSQDLNYVDFAKFIKQSQDSLKKALEENKDIVFVMGHKNPDTDTSISCLFEAWRNNLLNKGKIVFIPIIQSKRIPDEVKRLLGELSDYIVLSNNQFYIEAKESGLARWISVDQNKEPSVQKYFISIIDHHIVSDVAKNQNIPKTLEMLGSTAALITIKYLGAGLILDEKLAKLLYGATLMDTENRVVHKMTFKDKLVMDYLKKIANVLSDNDFYKELMSFLLNSDDSELLFKRDYKEDWGFGFAVAKIKKGISNKGIFIKKDLIKNLKNLAKQNNLEKNLPMTMLKITDYKEDNETVNREGIYIEFNKKSSIKFKETIINIVKTIVNFEFPGNKIKIKKNYLEFWGGGMQLSRKKTAPILEPVVKAFNQFFYSKSIKKWIKRDFLMKSKKIDKIGKFSTDKNSRINYINYKEAKELSEKMNFSMLSLSEYWKVLKDAKKIKDIQMINSLQGSNFVEFLDTALIKDSMINHPRIKNNLILGTRKKVFVPKGNPGLLHPDDIDIKTGIPIKVRSPNEYGNKELWRYWQPDAEVVFPCRSFIFLMSQPCWDGKFHLKDSFPNLGIRPVVKSPPEPGITTIFNEEELKVEINIEEDMEVFIWKKNIWDNFFD